MLNGSATLALEAVHHIIDEEELPMSETTTQRIFDKLDEISSTQATTATDVARIQGAQRGIELALDTVKVAIGDVISMKIKSAESGVKLDNLERELAQLAANVRRAETRTWVENLVKPFLAALGGAGIGATAINQFFTRG